MDWAFIVPLLTGSPLGRGKEDAPAHGARRSEVYLLRYTLPPLLTAT